MVTYRTYFSGEECGSYTDKAKTSECVFLYNSGFGSMSMFYTLKFKMNKKASPKIEMKIKPAIYVYV